MSYVAIPALVSERGMWLNYPQFQAIASMKTIICCTALQAVLRCKFIGRNRKVLIRNDKRIKYCTWLSTKLPAGIPRQYGIRRVFHTNDKLEDSVLNGFASDSQDRRSDNSLSFTDEILGKSIAYEVEHGFTNKKGRTMRFGEFLYIKLSSMAASSETDMSLQILVDEARAYEVMNKTKRIIFLNKVSDLLGFHNVQDLVEHQAALREATQNLGNITELTSIHSSLTIHEHSKEDGEELQSAASTYIEDNEHPSIIFGSSDKIELFEFPDREDDIVKILSEGDNREEESLRTPSGQDKMPSSNVSPFKTPNSGPMRENVEHGVQIRQISKHSGNATSQVGVLKASFKQYLHTKEESYIENQALSDSYESWLLNKPIGLVKILSSYQRSQLDEHGLHTVRKLLQHFPRTYVNFHPAEEIVEDGQFVTFFGQILSSQGRQCSRNLGLLEILVKSDIDHNSSSLKENNMEKQSDGSQNTTVFLHLKRFFRGARFCSSWFLRRMEENYPARSYTAVSGKVKVMEKKNHFEIKDFNVELLESKDFLDLEIPKDKPYPVYSSKGGLAPKFIQLCLHKVVGDLPVGIDPIPEDIRRKFGLMELSKAYNGIHTPPDLEIAKRARRRFVFDEFFYLQLGLLMQRKSITHKYLDVKRSSIQEKGSLDLEKWSPLTLKLLQALPFQLTPSQIKASSEIMWDLRRPVPMSRLLQGDVGCGKSIVAFLALLEVIGAGYQGAWMVPTEFLAKQHYERIVSLLENLEEKDRPQVALLTSSVTGTKARAIREDLENGQIALAVGTHSLISNSVKFAALGVAVIDEQHRFGVHQRIRLNHKGLEMNAFVSAAQFQHSQSNSCEDESSRVPLLMAPHMLAMSATPIPRTLALALHGDMAFSQITDLPPGRIPVKTYAFRNNQDGISRTYKMIHKDLQTGGRILIVYPIIEESSELPTLKAATVEYDTILKEFKDYSCGLVHGRLNALQKEETMRSFRSGKIQVLVSTTVIEVGVDIPEASMIVIVNAERYGVAQLHQLRGRVGRGTRESTCVLLANSGTALERLKLLEESMDGFYLAEMDLKLRGPGDLLGKQQSGHIPEFAIARLEDDGEIMNDARLAAKEILRDDYLLEDLPQLRQELSFRRPPTALGIS